MTPTQQQIYYFSGTGNSLQVAKLLSEQLNTDPPISIADIRQQKKVNIKGVSIIVCPVYMYEMPHIVREFIQKIEDSGPVYMVYSGGGSLGNGIKHTLELFESIRPQLQGVFNVKMPSNYTPYGAPSEAKQKEMFRTMKRRIPEIAETIRKGDSRFESSNTGFLQRHIFPGLLYKLGYKYIHVMDKKFSAGENCTGCGICEKVCPVSNIRMSEQRPNWQGNCEQCYACLQWCPEACIEAGNKTKGVPRYHHPEIQVKEIIGKA